MWRKYESRGGRWTTPDPYTGSMSVGDPQSLNRYAYVSNDPVNRIDPSGLQEVDPWDVVIVDVNDMAIRQLFDNGRSLGVDAAKSGGRGGGIQHPLRWLRSPKNPSCLQNAVIGSPGVGRPFSVDPQGDADHDGAHSLSPPGGGIAVTLPALVGQVIYWNDQEPGLFTVRVKPDGGNFVVVYKDLASVSAIIRQSLPKGVQGNGAHLGEYSPLGNVRPYAAGDPENRGGIGLHVSLVRSQYYDAFAKSTKKDNSRTLGSRNPAYYFIDPLRDPESPIRCPK
jgi:hypothetical protein